MWGLAMNLVDQIPLATTIKHVRRNQKVELDHVGFAGHSLELMSAEWRRLGFRTTQPDELRRLDADGAVQALGQRSCHIVFERGYIELTEVATPAPEHHLAPWLERGAGLHILAFGVADLQRWRESLAGSSAAFYPSAGERLSPSMTATRHIDYGTHHGDARFRWCMRDARDTPWALECIVQHLTPELVHQQAVQDHPNGALALTAVGLQCPDPEATRQDHRALYGFQPEGAIQEVRYGAGPVARCSMIEVALRDLAGWRCFGVEHAVSPDGAVEVALTSAPGCTLRLVQA